VDSTEALIERIATEIWNRGRLEVCDEVMSQDATYHGPHMPGGKGAREDWKRAIEMYRGAFPDSHVVYEEITVCGDRVIGRWTATATHTGPMPGLPPTGRESSISGITIYRIANGQIVQAWEELDLLGMWHQLGVFVPPGHGQ